MDEPKMIAEVRILLFEGGTIQTALPQDSILTLGLLQFGQYQVYENIRKAQQEQRRKIAIAQTLQDNGSPHLKGV